ncbi:MAG: ubiquinol-cytochrome c reductase iron-sulfur subunit [Gammaproteobacteria bacterium]
MKLETAGTSQTRRRLLVSATALMSGVGVAIAAVPFICSMQPSARSRADNAPVTVDISRLQAGAQLTVTWRGRPVWILRRTAQMLRALESGELLQELLDPQSLQTTQQPAYAKNPYRSIRPEYSVLLGVCTHLGCIPRFRPALNAVEQLAGRHGGYICSCHGSRFDMAGRVFKNVPAPRNLVVPPHRYLDDGTILIGEDQTAV